MHISVCVCTYQRPELLARLLCELNHQETGGAFTYSIVVADNDRFESAKAVVAEFTANSNLRVTYCTEPRQNIALARNKAVENATGDFLAFIDDDEFPARDWLLSLHTACLRYKVDGVVGPVRRYFDEQPPQWILKGKFYERPSYETGLLIDWTKGRTNNLLVKAQIIDEGTQPFRQEFRTGEDQDFCRRMMEKGHVFIWNNEAIVYEVVPPKRWKRSFMVRRALLQGTASTLHLTGSLPIAKSLVAIPLYIVMLPAALLGGQHKFMALLLKLCDHIGRVLSRFHINLIRDPYVTA